MVLLAAVYICAHYLHQYDFIVWLVVVVVVEFFK